MTIEERKSEEYSKKNEIRKCKNCGKIIDRDKSFNTKFCSIKCKKDAYAIKLLIQKLGG